LRRKIRDVENSLPPGVQRPVVSDDFGDVFGFQLALVGDGFSYAEMEHYAKALKKELSVVKGVARVDLWGAQKKIVYVDVSQAQLSQLGVSDESIARTLQEQNMVVDAGGVDTQARRYRIAPTGEFKSPQDIADLTIRPSLSDTITSMPPTTEQAVRSSELMRIGDIAEIKSGYLDPPFTMMRFNGQPAIGLSISNIPGVNIVTLGKAIDERLNNLISVLPIGIEVFRVHWQSDIVAEAVNGFMVNFAEAVGIVLLVLTIAMGWRMGIIIGSALILTILASFIVMAVMKIDLQRMSLGALVIALGMMVDNAIVVADGIAIRFQQGMDRKKAAIEAASQPSMPLLGATVIAVMAFYPIVASNEGAGEYCLTLFSVVAISLLLSWIISVTVTPLQCLDMLPLAKQDQEGRDPYGGKFYGLFRGFLARIIRIRYVFLACMVILLIAAGVGFGQVKNLFFPDSSMPKLMIDYYAPEGARIQKVAADLTKAEQKLMADPRIESVSTFIGAGPPRFYLPVEPEKPNPSYAQLIVNVHDFRDVDKLIEELDPWFQENYPQAMVPIRKFGVGPSRTWKFEARISGPAVADPNTLRALADEGVRILEKSPLAGDSQTNWRQRVQKVVPKYSQERGRWTNVTRDDIAKATKRAYDGRPIGLYREQDDLIPIVLRHQEEDRSRVSDLDVIQVQPALSTATLPLTQVTDEVVTEWEDPMIWRRDRRRAIYVQSNPILGVTLPTLWESVAPEFEAIKLPPGYTMEWGGEYESSRDSQRSLIPGMVPAAVIVLFIIVALFNAFRPPLIILLTIPFALIGITAGLLGTDTPFGFMALLGAMSLAGMMIKNAIVLLDQINLEQAEGKPPYDAVLDSALSRLRPVVLAAATTVLGVIPLLQDVFWVGMATTIMAGLTFGTILTMGLVPVLYATLFRIPSPKSSH